jgi:hypothetical protein
MKTLTPRCLIEAIVLFILMAKTAAAQLEPACIANSPERRGEIGCSLVENKPLSADLKEPLFWHIDRFDSGESARGAISPTSVAFEAHGTWWLMTIESPDRRSSWRATCDTGGASGSATRAEVFDVGNVRVYPAWADIACP